MTSLPAHLLDMVPGTPVASLDDLATLPQRSIVLVRSSMQPYFRTAWTLTGIDGMRFWTSGSWRAQPNDEELFSGAMEPIILLYKPLEQFGVGRRRDDGWLDIHGTIETFTSLSEAQAKLPAALESDPEAVLAHRIDPGPWEMHTS